MKGALADSPIFWPPTKNSTRLMVPSLSLAMARKTTVAGAWRKVPLTGLVIATEGTGSIRV